MKQLPKIHESRLVEPRYKIEQMDLEFANGERRTYERIHGSGRPVVVIVPMLDADTVLLAASAPQTAEVLTGQGLRVVTVDISEFEKLEGCVTCLSVRLRR